jgi:hypothetical protein
LDGCDQGLNSWTTGDELYATKDFNPIAEKLIKEGVKRKNALASDSVLDNGAIEMGDEIDLREVVLRGVMELISTWARHNKDNCPDLTLVAVQGILGAVNNAPGLSKIWRDGARMPLWMKEKYVRLKILFIIKEGNFDVRTFRLMVQGSVCEEAVCITIVNMMPEEHPQFKPASQCKPQSLRSWWTPQLHQMRVVEYGISKMVVFVFKCPADLERIFRRMFECTFPQLSGLDSAEQDLQPEDGKKPDGSTTMNLETDDFNDIDIDFDELDAPTMPATEVQKRKDAVFLISDEAIMNARAIVTILWPDLFKECLAESVEQYASPSPPVWIRALKSSDHFKDFFRKAQQL